MVHSHSPGPGKEEWAVFRIANITQLQEDQSRYFCTKLLFSKGNKDPPISWIESLADYYRAK